MVDANNYYPQRDGHFEELDRDRSTSSELLQAHLAIRLLAPTLAQVEAASAHVAQHGLVRQDGQAQPILKHLGTITNTAARLCDRLGLTPMSRAALGLAVSQTCR